MMAERPARFEPDTKLLELYVKWIEQFDVRDARAWGHRYKNYPEAAMCEATYWGVLQDCGVTVEPGGDLHSGQQSPDFRCHKNGERFYVEVTCMLIDRVAKHTSLVHGQSNGGAQAYDNLNSAIFEEVKQKTPQCANLDAPALVAVGTFHFPASRICLQKHHIQTLLTGDPMFSWQIDAQTAEPVSDLSLSTKLRSAAFLTPANDSAIEKARRPVSGLLVGGFGCRPPNVLGLLHPDAVRPFNRQMLDRIEFCRLRRDDAKQTLSTQWV